MNTYSILWLDDEPISDLPLIKEEHPNFMFQQVTFMDVCERLLEEHSTDYHAVILDANGLRSGEVDKSPNKQGFIKLVKLTKGKGLPVYIFSGQIVRGAEESDITLEFLKEEGFHENLNIFYKSGGSDPLMKQIHKDLDQGYYIFYRYPKILDNILHYRFKESSKKTLKELLIWMNDKKIHKFPDMTKLRRIIYDDENEIYGQVKELLGFKKDEFIDFKKRDPHEICMEDWEVDVVSSLLKKLLNANTHKDQSDNEYLQEIVANSVIVTLEWFNRFMHKFANTKPTITEEHELSTEQPKTPQIEDKTPTGVVVKDEKTGLFIVNNQYIIPPKWGWKYVDKRVRIDSDYTIHKNMRIAKRVKEV